MVGDASKVAARTASVTGFIFAVATAFQNQLAAREMKASNCLQRGIWLLLNIMHTKDLLLGSLACTIHVLG